MLALHLIVKQLVLHLLVHLHQLFLLGHTKVVWVQIRSDVLEILLRMLLLLVSIWLRAFEIEWMLHLVVFFHAIVACPSGSEGETSGSLEVDHRVDVIADEQLFILLRRPIIDVLRFWVDLLVVDIFVIVIVHV